MSPSSSQFSFEKISEDELLNALRKIKSNKTAGHDKITNKLLKAAFFLTTLNRVMLRQFLKPMRKVNVEIIDQY